MDMVTESMRRRVDLNREMCVLFVVCMCVGGEGSLLELKNVSHAVMHYSSLEEVC